MKKAALSEHSVLDAVQQMHQKIQSAPCVQPIETREDKVNRNEREDSADNGYQRNASKKESRPKH